MVKRITGGHSCMTFRTDISGDSFGIVINALPPVDHFEDCNKLNIPSLPQATPVRRFSHINSMTNTLRAARSVFHIFQPW